MANIKASKKDIIKSRKKQQRNLKLKTKMKTVIKNTLKGISSNSEKKQDQLKEALKVIDKTAGKGVIHKRTAARRKSRLAKAFNKKA